MFFFLALVHRHLKRFHCLVRAAVLTSLDEFLWQRRLIEFSFLRFSSSPYSSCCTQLPCFSRLVPQRENQFFSRNELRSYSSPLASGSPSAEYIRDTFRRIRFNDFSSSHHLTILCNIIHNTTCK